MHFSTTTTTRSVTSLAVLLLSSALAATARDVPQNVRDFYNKVRGSRECANPLASGFWSTNWGTDGVYFILFFYVPSLVLIFFSLAAFFHVISLSFFRLHNFHAHPFPES